MWQRNIMVAVALAPAAALGEARYEEAEVVDVEPIVEIVERVEPREQCRTETVRVAAARAESHTAPLFGALIGGALGNAVGHKKRNKQVGAVIGALVGGAIAADVAQASSRRSRLVRQEVCEVEERVKRVERVAGYMVTYRHRGDIHRARMDKRPGEKIRVRVRVEPA